YSLALKFTAKTSEVARKVRGLGRDIDNRLSLSNSIAARGVGKIAYAFGGVASSVIRIGGLISGVFVGGLQMAFGLVGRIASGLRSLPMAGLKLLLGGAAGVFAAHKALSPAGEMERYKVQLDVMKKGGLYNFLTKASAGKPFQLGETVQAGVLMEAFKISSKKFLSTVMDAAAGFKKPLEEVVQMLAFARSGRAGEALESASRIGITRGDLKLFGIKFEKSGAVAAESAGKLMTSILALMKNRFGGMATRIGTGTYEGAVSDLKDSVFRAFANAGEKFLPFATKIVRSVSGIVTSIGDKLATLPWDRWGAKLAAGVETAGRVIDNLMDPKRRADIVKSITDGWNAVKGDIPKLGKALALDLVDLVTGAFAAKMSVSFDSIFKNGGLLLGALITDPLILLWNDAILPGLVWFAKLIANSLVGVGYYMQRSYTWTAAGIAKLDAWKKDRDKITEDSAKQQLAPAGTKGSWKMATTTSIYLESWKKELELLGKTGGAMGRTVAVWNEIKTNPAVDKIVENLTAGPKFDPIVLSPARPGSRQNGGNGYINGQAVPLSLEQLRGNAAMEQLARLLPDMFSIKKETDVFGRELRQLSNAMQAGNTDNQKALDKIYIELRKLNANLAGG
ncbi:MAG: hypothetical protein PHV82_13670, partial [Victivallaceae bacterium]|nr:hypothetical protein [Victivallaceae bacterium]